MNFEQAHRLDNLHVSGTRVVFSKCAELAAQNIPVTALTLGEPDFSTPQYIVDACKRSLDAGQTRYTDGSGILELKEAVCEKLARENGLHYTPAEISVTTGVAQGMFVALLSTLNPGDEVKAGQILGKTGTGKELTAHALHALSSRAAGPFISINCAAIPKELFEAELFGYAPGAFSDARKEGKIGQMELANGGTLFLDEIGDIPLHAQVKLLRVLEEKRITRLGDVSGREVDFRLITATNRDLQDMISQESFREDLYYRINTLTIRLPPLRARTEDILPLARQILSKIGCATADFTDQAVRALEAYSWPGNVRQLFNSLVHATLHQSGGRIDAGDLPAEVTGNVRMPERHSPPQRHHDLAAWLSAQEAGFLTAALQENQGNVTATARQLGISRVTLYAKLKKYGIPQFAADTDAPKP